MALMADACWLLVDGWPVGWLVWVGGRWAVGDVPPQKDLPDLAMTGGKNRIILLRAAHRFASKNRGAGSREREGFNSVETEGMIPQKNYYVGIPAICA